MVCTELQIIAIMTTINKRKRGGGYRERKGSWSNENLHYFRSSKLSTLANKPVIREKKIKRRPAELQQDNKPLKDLNNAVSLDSSI